MGLEPLEFSYCLTDSPVFRKMLLEHEKELERTSKAIKSLINDGKDLLHASKHLAKAQKQFSQNLQDFNFECIGHEQTDDEKMIAGALKSFGDLMSRIEDERERMLEKANDQFIKPLENFRKIHIGQAKEEKKQFEKHTAKFCSSLDRYLSMKTKVTDNVFKEADAALDAERRCFYQQSMKYVLQLQEVQERKKFEFVEILLVFMYSLLTFYHEGHETAADCKPYLEDLQHTLQKTRTNFETTREQAEKLMMKMLDGRGSKSMDTVGTLRGKWTREGYLYLMEKKALATVWTKYWCCYNKDTKKFFMLPFNQAAGKLTPNGETVTLKSCTRRATDSIERRFCLDLTVQEKTAVFTFQALSEDDRKFWMDAMDGKEPIYNKPNSTSEDSSLDDIGFSFIKRCISAIENRGLDDQGLYRVVGVNSKVSKMIGQGLDKKKAEKLDLNDPTQYETKTITSAVKNYLRSLPEPLMTFKYHVDFITAASYQANSDTLQMAHRRGLPGATTTQTHPKVITLCSMLAIQNAPIWGAFCFASMLHVVERESKTLRLHDIHTLAHKLPESNFEMLDLIIAHLRRVARNSNTNLMTVANLGVCFGPTLMRPEEETVAAIMDIKFCNIVIEILVENYEMIFKQAPEDPELRTNLSRNSHVRGSGNHTPKPHVTATASVVPGSQQSPRLYGNQAPGLPYGQNRAKLRPVDVFNPTTGSFETQTNNSTSGSSESLNSTKSNHVNNTVPTPSYQDPVRRGYGGGVGVGGGVGPPGRGPAPGKGPTPGGPIYTNINVSELANRLILSTSDVPTLPKKNARHSGIQSGIVHRRISRYQDNYGYGYIDYGHNPSGSIKKRTACDHSTSSMSTSMQGTPTTGRAAVSMTGSVSGSLGSGISNNSNSAQKRRTVRTLYHCEAENVTELSFEPNQIIKNVRASKEPGWLEGTLDGRTGLIPENYIEYID